MVGAKGCKIGVSSSVARRLVMVADTEGDVRLVYQSSRSPDCFRIERLAHAYLCNKALGGEWFAVHPDEAVNAVRDAEFTIELNGPQHSKAVLAFEGKSVPIALPQDVVRWVRHGCCPYRYDALVRTLMATPVACWPERLRQ